MKNIKSLFRIIQQLDYILLPKHKRRFIPLVLVMLISSALELLGVMAILPFIQTILEPGKVQENRFIASVLKWLGIQDVTMSMPVIGIGLIVLYLLKNILMLFFYYFQFDYSSMVYRDLSLRMMRAYFKRPYEYYHNVNSAEILRGISDDPNGVYNILSNLITLLTEIILCMVIGVYIMMTDWKISLGVIAIMLFTMVVMIIVFKPISKRLGEKNFRAITERNKALLQMTDGIKELYVTDRKHLFEEKYKIAVDEFRKANRNYNIMSNSPDRIVEGLCVSGLIGIVVVRLLMDSANMVTFVPKLATFAMAAFKIMPSIGKITNRITGIVYNLPEIENVCNNMREAAENEKKNRSLLIEERDVAIGKRENKKIDLFKSNIELKNVTWQYEDTREPVLKNLSLIIKKGESVAFVGPSGSGKTTLADIILGLLRPQVGSVLVDGVDIFAIPHIWAKMVGYVPQSVFLMDDTIRANVAFGISNFTDDEIWEALDRAALGEYVRSLPDKLDTMVGEKGIKFSGGQRQRVAIARALFEHPQILVLDEATSALDNEAEKAIMESIDLLQGTVTLIIIAHRLTTIKNCDRVYEISCGEACEKEKKEVLMHA